MLVEALIFALGSLTGFVAGIAIVRIYAKKQNKKLIIDTVC